MRVLFDEWTYDSDRRELIRGAVSVPVSPKAFDLLGMLLASRPRVLSKAAIRDGLWPETFVSESRLTSVMTELRDALEDDARQPRFVRTVHGFGYAFCGSARDLGEPAAPRGRAPSSRLIWKKRVIPLVEGENILGRTEEAVEPILAPTISRRHARIIVTAEGATLEDLGSKNGTFLRGSERLTRPVPLADCDRFCLGSEWMTFRSDSDRLTTRTGQPVVEDPEDA